MDPERTVAAALNPTPLVALVGPSGPLSVADLEYYRITGPDNSNWEPQKITHRHHRVCQLAAQGESIQNIAGLVGYSAMQVSNILNSEAGKSLVAKYSTEILDGDMAFLARTREVRDQALEVLSSDLQKNTLHGKDLVSALTNLMDRTGHGPSRTVDANFSYDIGDKALGLLEANRSNQARVIEEPIDVGGISAKELEAGDRGLDLDGLIQQATIPETVPQKDDAGAKGRNKARKHHREIVETVNRFLGLASDPGAVD